MFKLLKTIVLLAVIAVISSISTISVAAEAKTETKTNKNPAVFEEMVVTATRSEVSVDMTSKPITVIDKEKIDTYNTASVMQILDGEVPGISVSRSGPTGGQVSFRGFNSNDLKSPLFIDGDRFHGRNTLEYELIDPNRIERIEVIRGPAAAMYGTDAMAGLVNIITRKAKGNVNKPFSLIPRIRSLDYSSVNNLGGGSVELEGLGNGFDMLLGASYKKAGDYKTPDGTVPESDLETSTLDFRLGYTPVNGHRIELSGKYAEVEHGYAGGLSTAPGWPYKTRKQNPMREKMIKLYYKGLNEALNLKNIEASLFVRELYTDNYGETRPRTNTWSTLTITNNYVDGPLSVGGKLFCVKPWAWSNTLTIGADGFRDKRKPVYQDSIVHNANGTITYSPKTQKSPAEEQTNVGMFLHNDWDPSDKWTVTASGRADYFNTVAETGAAYKGSNEDTERPLTGGFGVVYRPFRIIHFTANVNTSYRVPIAFEKYGTLLGYEPNPGLKPEKGVTYEMGMRFRLPQVNANLTAFRSEYTDLISRAIVPSTIYPGTNALQAQNIGEATIQGIELDSRYMVNDNWKLFMNASYLHGINDKTGRPLPYIAPLNGLVGVHYTPASKAFYAEATTRWSTRKNHIDIAQERETAAYGVFNLYFGFGLQKLLKSLPDMQMRLALENLLDKAYVSPVTPEDRTYGKSITNPLIEPGRNISVSLKSTF